MTAADRYYILANDHYPYNYEQVLEALGYGLSHDGNHPGLLTLKGKIYFNELHQYEAARECYELALANDKYYTPAYIAYIQLCVWMYEYEEAERLIEKALKIRGVDKATVYYFKSNVYERQNKYEEAKNCMLKARQHCLGNKCDKYYEEELERIEAKQKIHNERKTPINIVIK